jgi:HD-GYP domain-containing protein (c-di-GMP phosphodiesterase class II)
MQILKKVRGFEEIASWAADHHEAPSGLGYPHGLDGAKLALEARILRVADIFQAMVQDRPYRKGLSRQAVSGFMAELAGRHSIDASIDAVLQAHLDELIQMARAAA